MRNEAESWSKPSKEALGNSPNCVSPIIDSTALTATNSSASLKPCCRRGWQIGAEHQPIYEATPAKQSKNDPRRWRSFLSFKKVMTWLKITSLAIQDVMVNKNHKFPNSIGKWISCILPLWRPKNTQSLATLCSKRVRLTWESESVSNEETKVWNDSCVM